MPTTLDLNSIESTVRIYLNSSDSSMGWELVDSLERAFVAGTIRNEDQTRARTLLEEVRSKFPKHEELRKTEAAVKKCTQEYEAGFAAYSQSNKTHDLWSALEAKRLEKEMYERRQSALDES